MLPSLIVVFWKGIWNKNLTVPAIISYIMAKKNIRKCNLSPAHQAVFFSFENHFHQVRYIPVTNTPPVPLERIGELKAIKKYKKQQKPP